MKRRSLGRGIGVCLLAVSVLLSWNMLCFSDFYVVPVVKRDRAPVEKTGQTSTYYGADDGDLQKGVTWPDPRFTDNGDGTVTDNLTDLVWLKDTDCYGQENWVSALTSCHVLEDGLCGLGDGSGSGDWRLPNIKELQSLIDFANAEPVLPTGHPFVNVQSQYYWSSTTYADETGKAWAAYLGYGYVYGLYKTSSFYVWCVRGGR